MSGPKKIKEANLPSVTQVLSLYSGMDAIRPDVLDATSYRGTAVHAACLSRASGSFYLLPDEQHWGYFESFTTWFDSFVDEVILVEKRFTSLAFQFHGQLDLLALLKNEEMACLIDLKTSASAGRTWCAQLAAYKHLAECHGYRIGRVFSLRLRENGGMPIANEYTYSDRDFAAFLAALTAWRYFKS